MEAFVAPLRQPVIAFISALFGAWIAANWYGQSRAQAIAVAVVALLAALAVEQVGRTLLPRHPLAAVHVLNGTVLAYVALTALTGAAAIVITVTLATPDKTPEATKQLYTAVTTAFTTFVGAIFVTTANSDEALGEHIHDLFEAAYPRAPGDWRWKNSDDQLALEPHKTLVRAAGDADTLVSGTQLGWGHADRLERAGRLDRLIKAASEKNRRQQAQAPQS